MSPSLTMCTQLRTLRTGSYALVQVYMPKIVCQVPMLIYFASRTLVFSISIRMCLSCENCSGRKVERSQTMNTNMTTSVVRARPVPGRLIGFERCIWSAVGTHMKALLLLRIFLYNPNSISVLNHNQNRSALIVMAHLNRLCYRNLPLTFVYAFVLILNLLNYLFKRYSICVLY